MVLFILRRCLRAYNRNSARLVASRRSYSSVNKGIFFKTQRMFSTRFYGTSNSTLQKSKNQNMLSSLQKRNFSAFFHETTITNNINGRVVSFFAPTDPGLKYPLADIYPNTSQSVSGTVQYMLTWNLGGTPQVFESDTKDIIMVDDIDGALVENVLFGGTNISVNLSDGRELTFLGPETGLPPNNNILWDGSSDSNDSSESNEGSNEVNDLNESNETNDLEDSSNDCSNDQNDQNDSNGENDSVDDGSNDQNDQNEPEDDLVFYDPTDDIIQMTNEVSDTLKSLMDDMVSTAPEPIDSSDVDEQVADITNQVNEELGLVFEDFGNNEQNEENPEQNEQNNPNDVIDQVRDLTNEITEGFRGLVYGISTNPDEASNENENENENQVEMNEEDPVVDDENNDDDVDDDEDFSDLGEMPDPSDPNYDEYVRRMVRKLKQEARRNRMR